MPEHIEIRSCEQRSSRIQSFLDMLVPLSIRSTCVEYFSRKAKAIVFLTVGGLSLALASCDGVPAKPQVILGRDSHGNQRTASSYEEGQAQRSTVFGDGGLFGDGDGGAPSENSGGGGLGVNSYLWRASLDTISFMPVSSADPFGGVIITDWHSPGQALNERFKLNVYILGRALRADGVRVAVFRQVQDRTGLWRDAELPGQTSVSIEDAILTRARQLRNETLIQ